MKIFQFFTIFNLSSVVFKKMFIVFLISVLSFSTLIPKNQEFRDNFISALNCAVNTIETNFYDQYSATVMSAVNYVMNSFNIETLAEMQLTKQQAQNKDNKSQTPVNTSSDNGVIMQDNTNNQIETIKASLYGTVNRFYDFYESIKINSDTEAQNIGILFFILFSILIVRTKDIIAVSLNNIYKNKMLNRLG